MDDILSRFEHEPQPAPEQLLHQQMDEAMALSIAHTDYEYLFSRSEWMTQEGKFTVFESYEDTAANRDPANPEWVRQIIQRSIRIPGAVGIDRNGVAHADKEQKGYFEIEFTHGQRKIRNYPLGDSSRPEKIKDQDEQESYIRLAGMKLGEALIEARNKYVPTDVVGPVDESLSHEAGRHTMSQGRIRSLGQAALRRLRRR
jgi:hypothetical protein